MYTNEITVQKSTGFIYMYRASNQFFNIPLCKKTDLELVGFWRNAFTKKNQNKQQYRENRNFCWEKKIISVIEENSPTMKHAEEAPENILIKK